MRLGDCHRVAGWIEGSMVGKCLKWRLCSWRLEDRLEVLRPEGDRIEDSEAREPRCGICGAGG